MLGCGPLPDLSDSHRDLSDSLPVFPGAQGFGTDTVAGRGGEVLIVDTLAASGPGSLAEALATPGPRTVLFEVAGVIRLEENLSIQEPFLTLAGQSAPPPGITLAGAGLVVNTHDVLIQHLAIRPGGDASGPAPENRDAIAIIGVPSGDLPVYNVVVDHVSLSWSVDEQFSTWYPGVRDVTLSYALISEALNESVHPEGAHSKALLVGDHTRRVSVHHSVLAHNHDRNPISKGDSSALFSNLLVYNPGRWPVTLFDQERSGPTLMALQECLFIPGADTPLDHSTVLIDRSAKDGTQVYLRALSSWDDGGVEVLGRRDEVLVEDIPVSVTPLLTEANAGLLQTLPNQVGSRPAQRDPVDTRVIQELADGEGRIIDRVADVGGWAALESMGTRQQVLVLPEDPSGDRDSNGYTNLEEWLHDLAAELEAQN